MNSLEPRLSERLHELAGGDPGTTPPTQRLLARGRQARRRRTAVTGTSLALIAAGAIAAVAISIHPATPSTTADRPPTAQMQLMAAITASKSTSYQMKITLTAPDTPGSPETVSQGAFDPAAATGYLHTPYDEGPGFTEERLVDGVQYLGDAGVDRVLHWRRLPGRHDSLRYDGSLGGNLSGSANPDELFDMLAKAGATVTQTGARTFHFEFTPAELPKDATSDHFAGDVTLNSDKRIAKVTYERAVQWQKPGLNRTEPLVHVDVTIEFSGYGTPVKVEAPADAQAVPPVD